jgi:CRP-like cAMP-binding protein
VLKAMQDGELRELARLSAPTIFGEMSVFNEEPRSATIQALNACVVLEVERDDLRPLLQNEPKILEMLAAVISQRRAELLKLSSENSRQQEGSLLSGKLTSTGRFLTEQNADDVSRPVITNQTRLPDAPKPAIR